MFKENHFHSVSVHIFTVSSQRSLEVSSSANLLCFVLQNALPSDDDDKDPNDPHKALDIDLDKWVLFYICSTFITLTADFEDAEVIIFISKLVCQALKCKIFAQSCCLCCVPCFKAGGFLVWNADMSENNWIVSSTESCLKAKSKSNWKADFRLNSSGWTKILYQQPDVAYLQSCVIGAVLWTDLGCFLN